MSSLEPVASPLPAILAAASAPSPSPRQAGVTVQGLTKRFTARGTPAVSDVSFRAPAGGITTLLGPSGSGKSTVLRIIVGLVFSDSGRVLFGERDFTNVQVQSRGVGFVFQS